MAIGKVAFFLCLLAITPVHAESISRAQWLKVQSLHGIASSQGVDNPSLYVFFEPNCPASAKLFSSLIKGIPFEKLDAVWIPVSYMESASLGRSAAILRSGDFSSIKKNYLSFNFKNGLGAIRPVGPSQSELSEIRQSNEVWKSLYATQGTPLIVYRDKKGGYNIYLGYTPQSELERMVDELDSARISTY